MMEWQPRVFVSQYSLVRLVLQMVEKKVKKNSSGRSPRLVSGPDKGITARPQAALGPKTHLITVKSNCSVVSGIPILW